VKGNSPRLARTWHQLEMSLRPESLGREEEPRTQKPFIESMRVRIPPGKAGSAARNESCVVVGRPTLRSVDSEVKGRVIELRKLKTLGTFVVDISGDRVGRSYIWSRRRRLILPGSKDTDKDHQGFPGTWETRWSPPTFSGSGPAIPTPRSPRPSVPAAGSKSDARVVSPGDHEGRREGRTGVGAPHMSVEAGERALPDPAERRGRRVVDQRPEPRRGNRTSERVPARSLDRARDSEPAT
jgi:hypothetical protein